MLFTTDLFLLGQLFFIIGLYAKKILSNVTFKNEYIVKFALLFFCLVLFYCFNLKIRVSVDWPSRKFQHPVFDVIAGLNGTLFLFLIASFIERLPKRIKNVFTYIGQNSIGVLFFHFLCFKIIFCVAYKLHKFSSAELSNVVPPTAFGNKWWLIITIFSVAGSLIAWEILKRTPVLKFLIGAYHEKYNEVYQKIKETRILGLICTALNKLCLKVNRICSKCIGFVKTNPIQISICLVFVVSVVIPLWNQAIMCNDEVQSRFWASTGLKSFFAHYASAFANQGRTTQSLFHPIFMYLGFIAQNSYLFKIEQVLTIFLCVLTFSTFLYKLFGNKRFSLFYSLVFFAFLPITFEHTSPNAFVSLFNIELAAIFLSFILFLSFIDNGQKSRAVLSMLCLFIAELGYEAFICFAPVYIMLLAYKTGIKGVGKNWKCILWPFVTSLLFLSLYVLARKLFPGNYAGASVGKIDIFNSTKIILKLLCSAFPGRYLFSGKYRYLLNIYMNLSFGAAIRIVVCAVTFCFAARFVFLQRKSELKECNSRSRIITVILCGLLSAALPILPISIASMYQNAIGENGFMALPVTFFGYFFTVFVCCFFVWKLTEKMQSKEFNGIILTIAVLVIVPIQLMNDSFSNQQKIDFQRMQRIERFLKSNFFNEFQSEKFYSEDLYERRNVLAIHSGFWTQYSQFHGNNIQIENEPGTVDSNRIYFDDYVFAVWYNNNLVVASENPLKGHTLIRQFDDNWGAVDTSSAPKENSYYVAYFLYDNNEFSPCDRYSFLYNKVIGCKKVSGFHHDGWMSRIGSVLVNSTKEGTLSFAFYNPSDLISGETIDISIDGTLVSSTPVKSGSWTVEVPVEPTQAGVSTVEIKTDYLQKDTGGDTRELALILSDVKLE